MVFMWEQYRKTLIPTQILIVGICVLLAAHWHLPLLTIAVFFVVMESFSFFGALWGLRLKRKIQRSRGLL
jgi:hypothetical protein